MRLVTADDTVIGLAERGQGKRVSRRTVEDKVDFALGFKQSAEQVSGLGGPGIISIRGGMSLIGGLHGLRCFRTDPGVVIAGKLLGEFSRIDGIHS